LHDPTRGYLLEILLSKIKFIAYQLNLLAEKKKKDTLGGKSSSYSSSSSSSSSSLSSSPNKFNIQIIALSATIGNAESLAKWIHADFYSTNFRPTPLNEYIKAGNDIFHSDGKGLLKKL
jgi:DNA polymerase theta